MYEPYRTEKIAWRTKAHRIVYLSCRYNYTKTQISKTMNKKYKKYVPYLIPDIAKDLIDCLNHDNEEKAKAIFLSYEGMKLI